jgi:diguanylate cyclase (GGDEF)-like protein
VGKMGSFKFRLVTYFVLLALLPVLAASWAFGEVAARGETKRVDARLDAGLRVAIGDYSENVASAATSAAALARLPAVQQALSGGNRSALERATRAVPHATFYAGHTLLAGTPPSGPSARRSVTVTTPGGARVGRVVVWVPLDSRLVHHLRGDSGLDAEDELVLTSHGRVLGGRHVSGAVGDVAPGDAGYVELEGSSYRAIGTPILTGSQGVDLFALAPKSAIDDAVGTARLRLLLFAAGALAFAAMLAYLVGRTIVRPLKELSDAAGAVARGDFSRRVRVRGQDEFAMLGRSFNDMAAQLETRVDELAEARSGIKVAVSRFGEALAVTHEPHALMPLIVQSIVDATGAVGGVLMRDGKEIARGGDPTAGGKPLEISLPTGEGEGHVLLLTPAGDDFSDDARELAYWLSRQAGVALDNARLHRRIEREAITDGLTELPNRRQFEEALATEIGRVERFGGFVSLILADLDDFKNVNDRYGHQAGDDVLRAFAETLRRNVREIDLPARYGGEEFAVLLPQTDVAGATRLAERIRAEFASQEIETRFSAPLHVTASFGVAAFPDEPSQAALFAAADQTLYHAKRSGKNCVVAVGPTSHAPGSR